MRSPGLTGNTRKSYNVRLDSPIAQPVERRTVNPQVLGSSPGRGARHIGSMPPFPMSQPRISPVVETLNCLKKYGQRLDLELAKELGLPLAAVRQRLTSLAATGAVITCSLDAISKTASRSTRGSAACRATSRPSPPVGRPRRRRREVCSSRGKRRDPSRHRFRNASTCRGLGRGRRPRVPDQWRWRLSTVEVAELEAAARACLARSADLVRVASENFVLPTLQPKLEALRGTLIHGIGFEVIGGLPVDRMGLDLASAIFVGIGAHLGRARSQNAQGDLLGHVRDLGMDSRDPNTRIYQTSERQTFHTDSADVVGLLCLNEAREGGDSLLVSALAICNALRRERPDLLAYLFDDIATDRRGEVPRGAETVLPHTGLQLARRFPDGDVSAPVHRLGAALSRRATLDGRPCCRTRLFRRVGERSAPEHQHAARARRHAVRLQPQPAA